MDSKVLILVLFTILLGCDVRFAGYSEDINGSDAYTDIGYIDTGIYDTIQCEQYKCENLIYGRDDVYVDKESGNIYMVEFGSKVGSKVSSKDLKFFKYDKNGQLIWENKVGEVIVDDCSGRLWMVDREESFYITKYVQYCEAKFNCRCTHSGDIIKFSKDGEEYKVPFIIGFRNAYITSITTDDDFNIYIAGEYESVVDFGNGVVLDNSEECRNTGNPYNPVECSTDVFVAKFNREGEALWAKSLEDGRGTSIMLYNGFIYFDVRGYTEREEDGKKVYSSPYKVKIVKLDAGGNYKWSRILVQETFIDEVKFTVDKDGSIYLYGLFDLYPDYKDSDKYKDLNIAKFDKNGEFIWGKRYDEIGKELVNISWTSVFTDKSKNVYFAADIYVIEGNNHNYYFFISKYKENGERVWYKEFYEGYEKDLLIFQPIAIIKMFGISDKLFYILLSVDSDYNQQIDKCFIKEFPKKYSNNYLFKFTSEHCEDDLGDK